jgi:putative membrane-bound dehydrogenase-like protein
LLGGGRPPLFGQGTTGITVPDGFTVEIAAASPLVQHPLMAGFDDRGRLYVAESAGLNLDAAELLTQKPNYIRRLEDTDGDGKFDHTTIFADQMTFPSGALWHQGALYVASPPHIWRLEDTDDDGVADRREAIVGKFGFVGNAADIHGCFLGPNGRLYWCDGRHGHEFVDEQPREGGPYLFLPDRWLRHRVALRRRNGQSGRGRLLGRGGDARQRQLVL